MSLECWPKYRSYSYCIYTHEPFARTTQNPLANSIKSIRTSVSFFYFFNHKHNPFPQLIKIKPNFETIVRQKTKQKFVIFNKSDLPIIPPAILLLCFTSTVIVCNKIRDFFVIKTYTRHSAIRYVLIQIRIICTFSLFQNFVQLPLIRSSV